MNESEAGGHGVLASLRRVARTVLMIVENRLALLLVELQEERWRLFEALLLTAIVGGLGLLTLMTLTFTIVLLCVEAERFGLLAALILFYLAATIFGLWRLRVRLKSWAPFSATLAELRKDKSCWEEES